MMVPKPVTDYKDAGDQIDKDYDVIGCDFRYYKPPLAEICARLKPEGTLLVASMEENVFSSDATTAAAFARTKLTLSSDFSDLYSACE